MNLPPPTPPRILSIAGSDCSGGAGIQADIKTITMLGGYAMSAITAVTAQNTLGVQGAEMLRGEFVRQQITSCIEDIGADAIKIGMLGNDDIIQHVAAILVDWPQISAREGGGELQANRADPAARFPIILDPVMVASSGDLLAGDHAIEAMREHLFPLASIITPNLPELEILARRRLTNLAQREQAAAQLAGQYGCAVLAKGGHTQDETVIDLLVEPSGETLRFEHSRLPARHTHGTGCTLSAALATLMAQGLPLEHAVRSARQFVFRAIQNAPGFGLGNGPLGHQSVLPAPQQSRS